MAKEVPLVDSTTGMFSGKVLDAVNENVGGQIATDGTAANTSATDIAKRQAIIFAIALGS